MNFEFLIFFSISKIGNFHGWQKWKLAKMINFVGKIKDWQKERWQKKIGKIDV